MPGTVLNKLYALSNLMKPSAQAYKVTILPHFIYEYTEARLAGEISTTSDMHMIPP